MTASGVRVLLSVSVLMMMSVIFIGLPDRSNITSKNAKISAKMAPLPVTNKTITDGSVSSAFKSILLVSKPRSGSSWLGSLIAENPSVFYWYEPFHYENLPLAFYGLSNRVQKEQFLTNLLMCSIARYEEYFQFRFNIGLNFKNSLSKEFCELVPTFCRSSLFEVEQTICSRAKIRFMKTFIDTNSAGKMALDRSLDMGVIHLVRDPRAMILSRSEMMRVAKEKNVTTDARTICEEMQEDLFYSDRIERNRYYRIRYEDLALDPVREMKSIYEFIGLPYTSSIESFIRSKSQDNSRDMDPFSTNRVSSSRAFRWRVVTRFQEVSQIQNACGGLLEALGYKIFKSEEDYVNFTIPVLV